MMKLLSLRNAVLPVAAILLLIGVQGCRSYKGFTPKEVEKKAELYKGTEEEAVTTDPNVAYLEENAKNPGVIVRPSGLQIKVVKTGTGDYPTVQSEVTANYEGKLIDGTVFDTTRDSGEPYVFTMDSVIKGWREALTLMREGSVFQIVIPANLGYGSRGAQGIIPPGATLIFEIEMVHVTQPLAVKPASN